MPGYFQAIPSLQHQDYIEGTPQACSSNTQICLAAAVSLSAPVCSVTNSPDPRPQGGAAIPVTAFVLPNTAAVGTVQLTYLVNYGSPVTIPMTAAAGMCSCAPAT